LLYRTTADQDVGHTFGAANQETAQFSGDPNTDGLMGLALSTLSEEKTKTPPEVCILTADACHFTLLNGVLQALAAAGLISNAIVSYRIPRLLDGKQDGVVSFGGIDAVSDLLHTSSLVRYIQAPLLHAEHR
jgi:hypothetical protein